MQLWSWGLTVVGVSALYLAGKGGWRGWAVGLFAQALWLVYALVTKQYGFIVSVFAYGSIYVVNIRKALKQQREADEK